MTTLSVADARAFLADTTTVLALSAARGSYGPMTTVQQSTSFQRAVVGQDVELTARFEKLGRVEKLSRSLAFVDVTMGCEGDPAPGPTPPRSTPCWADRSPAPMITAAA